MPESRISWPQAGRIKSRPYICGHCSASVASDAGWAGTYVPAAADAVTFTSPCSIHICHLCCCPTFFDGNGRPYPGPLPGNSVQDIPDSDLEDLYNEARRCVSQGCYTAAVLCCRKLLMHIAVSKGADPGKKFIFYVQYLSDNNYVPPDASDWVDHVRNKGNEANHEIALVTAQDAEELIAFIEMLLKMLFEFPAAVQRRSTP